MYIIRVLVVTKSLCGYVSNQVQYNMESAQYNCSNTLTNQILIHSPRHAVMMFCSIAIVNYTHRNKIM